MMDMPPADSFSSNLEVCYEILLYLSSRLARLPEGESLEFITSDPSAPVKIPPWCEARDYTLLCVESLSDGRSRFVIQR